MKCEVYFIVLSISISTHSFCQQNDQSVISAAGDISKVGNISFEWTLGEPAVESVSTYSLLYTQGFHQPLLEVQRLTNSGNNLFKNAFRVFPNPATSVLNIQLDKPVKERLLVSLVDVSGRVLLNSTFPQEAVASKLDVRSYAHGTYILRITNQDGSLHSEFKVIKAR